DGGITHIALTGRADDFVVGWFGPIGTDSYGIWLQPRTLTGFDAADARIATEGAYVFPALAWDGTRTLLTFSVANSFSYAAGLTFDQELVPGQNEHFRLSSESSGL